MYTHTRKRSRETQLRRRLHFRRRGKARLRTRLTQHRIFSHFLSARRIHQRSSPFTALHVCVPYVLHTHVICSYKFNESSFAFLMARSYQCSSQTRELIRKGRTMNNTHVPMCDPIVLEWTVALSRAPIHTHGHIFMHTHHAIYTYWRTMVLRYALALHSSRAFLFISRFAQNASHGKPQVSCVAVGGSDAPIRMPLAFLQTQDNSLSCTVLPAVVVSPK